LQEWTIAESQKTRRGSAGAAGVTAGDVLFVPPAGGRAYDLGPLQSRFLADGVESDDRYCVSEWWLEPGQPGAGAHAHEANEELFYVLEGTMSFLAGNEWIDAPRGSFLRIPAGTTHDFENRTDARAGVLNVFVPGGFEAMMPRLLAYVAEQEATESSDP
jgi:mannose-6-phosphate isomerase-like protein (cupin superfamily)